MRKILAVLIITFFLGSFSYAYAQDLPTKNRKVLLSPNPTREAKKAERKAAKCDRIKENVAKKAEKYSKNKAAQLKHYANVKRKLNEIVAKLDKKGVNTTDLKNKIAGLDPLIATFTTAYDNFLNAVKNSTIRPCVEATASEDNTLRQAKESLKPVRAAARAIKDYYKDTIKPAIKALRQEAAAANLEKETKDETPSL